jgi:hypothetical protein
MLENRTYAGMIGDQLTCLYVDNGLLRKHLEPNHQRGQGRQPRPLGTRSKPSGTIE